MSAAIMQTHAKIGFHILGTRPFPLLQLAAEIALSHHERFDGKGYPNGLEGEQIPQAAASSVSPMSLTP